MIFKRNSYRLEDAMMRYNDPNRIYWPSARLLKMGNEWIVHVMFYGVYLKPFTKSFATPKDAANALQRYMATIEDEKGILHYEVRRKLIIDCPERPDDDEACPKCQGTGYLLRQIDPARIEEELRC